MVDQRRNERNVGPETERGHPEAGHPDDGLSQEAAAAPAGAFGDAEGVERDSPQAAELADWQGGHAAVGDELGEMRERLRESVEGFVDDVESRDSRRGEEGHRHG